MNVRVSVISPIMFLLVCLLMMVTSVTLVKYEDHSLHRSRKSEPAAGPIFGSKEEEDPVEKMFDALDQANDNMDEAEEELQKLSDILKNGIEETIDLQDTHRGQLKSAGKMLKQAQKLRKKMCKNMKQTMKTLQKTVNKEADKM